MFFALINDIFSHNTLIYQQWRSYNFPNMADVLNEFHSVHVDPEFLLTQLPLLQPRYYSISSSRKVTPEEVHLTMSVVSYKIHGERYLLFFKLFAKLILIFMLIFLVYRR